MADNTNPFGNGKGGDGKMNNGGNDFTKSPSPQSPGTPGNDFTKNPGGANGQTSSTPLNPPAFTPSGGRMPFAPKPIFDGKKPTPPFKLKG